VLGECLKDYLALINGPDGISMPKRTKLCVAAVAAMLAAATACVGLQFQPAGASTTTCGSGCTSPSVESLGTSKYLEVSSLGSPPSEESNGTPATVAMAAASTTNSAEDWTTVSEGTVAAAIGAGIVNAALGFNYGGDQTIELQYAPDGVTSNLCLAEGSPTNQEDVTSEYTTLPVTLVQCGTSGGSLWIPDTNNNQETPGYDDLINCGGVVSNTWSTSLSGWSGTATNAYAEPGVLAVTSSSKVVVAALSVVGTGVSQTEMWTAYTAPVTSELRSNAAKSG
jgi:hypothetical protein